MWPADGKLPMPAIQQALLWESSAISVLFIRISPKYPFTGHVKDFWQRIPGNLWKFFFVNFRDGNKLESCETKKSVRKFFGSPKFTIL